MSIAANRHPEIRCVLAHEPTTARLSRGHNDANALALGARMIGEEAAADILTAFLATPYEGGRHSDRIAKLTPPQELDA
jgi:ribose 5-phosphate isomerase B